MNYVSHVSHKQVIIVISGTIDIKAFPWNRSIALFPNSVSPRQMEAEMAHHWVRHSARPKAGHSALKIGE
jgi:hypothetical protein